MAPTPTWPKSSIWPRPCAALTPSALGRLAKTDALNAEALAHFSQAIRLESRPWKDDET